MRKMEIIRTLVFSLLAILGLGVQSARAGSYDLTENTLLRGVVFQANTKLQTFDLIMEKETPKEGTLGQAYDQGDITFPAGSVIKFDELKNVMSGTVGTGFILGKPLQPGSSLLFYPNGSPMSATLQQAVTIEPYKFSTATESKVVSFYDNGSVRSVSSATPFLYMPPGTYKSYSLNSGSILFWPTPVQANQTTFRAGPVKQAILQIAHIPDMGTVLPAGTTVGLDGEGELSYISSEKPFTYKNINLQRGGTIEITQTKNFSVWSQAPVVIGKITYGANKTILVGVLGNVIAVSQ